MKLQEKLDALKADFVKQVPPEALAVMKRATEDLRNSGLLDQVPKAGDALPPFELPNAEGTSVSSANLLSQGPLVLTIYRGVW